MYLAAHMRIPNVDRMMRSISNRQFNEWMAYFEMEPFGEVRDDYRNAQLMTLLANINRDPNENQEFSVEDFLLRFEKPEMETAEIDKETAIAAIEEIFLGLVAATGGQDLRPPCR